MAENNDNKELFPSHGDVPWLLYTHGPSKYKQFQSFYPVSTLPGHYNNFFIKSIPQLRGKSIIASSSSHGWLILCDRAKTTLFSIFNPVTLQVINFPELLSDSNVKDVPECLLTSSPDCDNCVLLLCYNEAGLMFFCHPAQADCSWVTQKLELQGETVEVSELVCLNGVIYGTSTTVSGHKQFFYMEDDLKSLTLVPLQISLEHPHLPYCRGYTSYRIESCGRIYDVYIYISHDFPDLVQRFDGIKVFELDLEEKSWVEVNCLKGRAFFLGSGGCTWCWGDTKVLGSSGGIEGNSIYIVLPRLLQDAEGEVEEAGDDTETLYLYNVLDQTWTILSACSCLIKPHDSPIWVIPQQQQWLVVAVAILLFLRVSIYAIWFPDTPIVGDRLLASRENIEVPNEEVCVCLSECQDFLQHNENQQRLLSKLPFDVLELIATSMHLFEYWNFRASCKMFHSAFPAPQWRTNYDLPLYMSFTNVGGLCTIIDPHRQDSRVNNSILPLLQKLAFSKDGWLLYLDGKNSVSFINVFTRMSGDYLPFPDNVDIKGLKSIAFSTFPTCSECLTVALFEGRDFLAFYCLHSGNSAWNIFFQDHEDIIFRLNTCTPIFVGGAFYFLSMCGYLGVFKLVDGQPSWRVYNLPVLLQDIVFHLSCLVECGGELYSVFIGRRGKWVQVFRFVSSEKKWVEIDDLGNHVLFISRLSSSSVVTRDPKMRNRIYLPRFRGKHNVFYSLDTKKFHVLGCDDSMEDLHGTKEPSWCCWI